MGFNNPEKDREFLIAAACATIILVALYNYEPAYLKKSASEKLLADCGEDLHCRDAVHEFLPTCFENNLNSNPRRGSFWRVNQNQLSRCIKTHSDDSVANLRSLGSE